MPQYPFAVTTAKNPSGGQSQANVDAEGNLITSTGGSSSKLNITAATVVKAAPGRIAKIFINGVVGTGGALTINDCATVAAAAAGNEIATFAGTIAVGTVINLDWPCAVGIVVSAVPTGGTPVFSISYD